MPADTHDLDEIAALPERPDIRLIASDMDGTLLSDDKVLHDDFWPLVKDLASRGVTFCPASGRQYFSLRRQFDDIAKDVVFIAENGTFVVDGATGAEIASDCISVEQAQAVIRAARDIDDAYVVLCGKRSAYIQSDDPEFVEGVAPYYAELRHVPELLEITDDEFLKVAIYDAVNSETNTAPSLAPFGDTLQVVVSGEHWVDVMSLTANKGEGLRHLQQRMGISPDQTMVFGDFLNDLEMMDAATFSFAMANAHPQLKKRAAWRAPANNANGVVRTIRTTLGIT